MVPFSEFVLSKARNLVANGKVEKDPVFPVWWSGEYRVQTDGQSWATCTCQHGLMSRPDETRCAHVAAVLLTLHPQ